MYEQKLPALINRTGKFHRAVANHVSTFTLIPEVRFITSYKTSLLSFEHAIGALILISNDLYAPGFSLYRPQFESVVRGIWLLYAASDEWVNKLSEPLTFESANRANEGLGLSDMFKQLDKSDAPEHLIVQLKQYREVTWKALNSYVHGGLHPISRAESGYPPQLAFDAIRNSNALVAISAQLTAILTGEAKNMEPIRQIHDEFKDCIPII